MEKLPQVYQEKRTRITGLTNPQLYITATVSEASGAGDSFTTAFQSSSDGDVEQ